jgi:hypothetical protein
MFPQRSATNRPVSILTNRCTEAERTLTTARVRMTHLCSPVWIFWTACCEKRSIAALAETQMVNDCARVGTPTIMPQ